MKVHELIGWLQMYDPNAEVMINGDSGTPDPCPLPNRIDTVFLLKDSNGNQMYCTADLLDDMRAEGYKVNPNHTAPLLWPS